MKSGLSLLLVVVVSSLAQPSQAFGFVIEHHELSNAQDFQSTSTTYVDIPGSERTITVETGRAIINWCLSARYDSTSAAVRIRPALGSLTPTQGTLKILDSGLSQTICGSWASDVVAGQMPVRLQVASVLQEQGYAGSFKMDPDFHSLTWTMLVLPTASTGVPAISTWGVGVLALLIVAAATIVASRPSGQIIPSQASGGRSSGRS